MASSAGRINGGVNLPAVAPMLSYEDVGTTADWLCAAFGFTEAGRFENGGHVTHVNLVAGDGVVMAGWPGPEYRNPIHHREGCADAAQWLDTSFVVDGVYVLVEDIHKHFEGARTSGARILSEPEENAAVGQWQYRAEDIEGHRWMFAQPL